MCDDDHGTLVQGLCMFIVCCCSKQSLTLHVACVYSSCTCGALGSVGSGAAGMATWPDTPTCRALRRALSCDSDDCVSGPGTAAWPDTPASRELRRVLSWVSDDCGSGQVSERADASGDATTSVVLPSAGQTACEDTSAPPSTGHSTESISSSSTTATCRAPCGLRNQVLRSDIPSNVLGLDTYVLWSSLPLSEERAGATLQRCVSVIDRLVDKLVVFKVGISSDPCMRAAGYKTAGDVYQAMQVLFGGSVSTAGMLEAALIYIYKGKPGNRNDRDKGGEGRAYQYPCFVYVVWVEAGKGPLLRRVA